MSVSCDMHRWRAVPGLACVTSGWCARLLVARACLPGDGNSPLWRLPRAVVDAQKPVPSKFHRAARLLGSDRPVPHDSMTQSQIK